jgi:Imelysin
MKQVTRNVMKQVTRLVVRSSIASLALSSVLAASNADLGVVKSYLLNQVALQKTATARLNTAASSYYSAAQAAGFDYSKLTTAAVRKTLLEARAAWIAASPTYESVEGIVAGVEMLAIYDVNLDAGASKADGGDGIVSFDLKLPNGQLLEKPGNLFGITESTLWGTEKSYSSARAFDVDGNGAIGFGDVLPDANVLKAAAAKLDEITGQLIATGKSWQPTTKDVVSALQANVPTAANVFIERWKTSRFVLGEKTKSRDFNVISSLNDLQQNIGSWKTLYGGLSGAVNSKNTNLDTQITAGLDSLKAWVVKLQAQEKVKRFSPEQAEIIGKEAQNRATAIVGKINQAAALLGVK